MSQRQEALEAAACGLHTLYQQGTPVLLTETKVYPAVLIRAPDTDRINSELLADIANEHLTVLEDGSIFDPKSKQPGGIVGWFRTAGIGAVTTSRTAIRVE